MPEKLEYYMNLPYKVEVTRIPENEGGGYMANLKEFGYAIVGDGETPDEAINHLREIQRDIFYKYIENEVTFPKPLGEK